MVVDEHGSILLVRRAIEPYRGQWALPGGYQEVDEDPAVTAAREILEESGIQVEILRLIDLVFLPAQRVKPANLAVYLCRPTGGTLRNGEDTLEAGWFDPDDLPEELGFENGPRIQAWLRDTRGGRGGSSGS